MAMYHHYNSRVFSMLLLLMMIHLPLLFCFSTSAKFVDEDNLNGLAQSKRHLASTSLVCGAVNCVKGTCVDSTILPLYECVCDEGWKSPLNASWLPCLLPNCSFDFACDNSSNIAAPPAPAPPTNGSLNACLLPICGNGECISTGNSSLPYECNCNPGSTNLFNTPSGYCVPTCSLGSDCANLNVTLISPSPPPPPSSASQGTSPSPSLSNQTMPSQGIRQARMGNLSVVNGILMLLIGWCL